MIRSVKRKVEATPEKETATVKNNGSRICVSFPDMNLKKGGRKKYRLFHPFVVMIGYKINVL